MKKMTIEGKEYTIRTLPLEHAPEVFEVIRKMFGVADKVVKESADPKPENRDETLKVFMAIVDHTQEKLREAKFFREYSEPLDNASRKPGPDTPQKADETSEPEEK